MTQMTQEALDRRQALRDELEAMDFNLDCLKHCDAFAPCDCTDENGEPADACQVLFHLAPLCKHLLAQDVNHPHSLKKWAEMLLEYDPEEYREPIEPPAAMAVDKKDQVEIMAERFRNKIGLHNLKDTWNRLADCLAMPAKPPRSGFGKHSSVLSGDFFVPGADAEYSDAA